MLKIFRVKRMIFVTNVRKLFLGLAFVSAAFGMAKSACADVLFDVSTPTPHHYARLLTSGPTAQWNSASAGEFRRVSLSGSDRAEFQGITQGYLSFMALGTGPSTAGPTLSLTDSFILTSGKNGTGTVLLQGTGTSTLTRATDGSVSWVSTFSNFTSDLIAASELANAAFTFIATSNKTIPVGSTFPQFSSFDLSGQLTATVPEPSTLALLAMGGFGAGVAAIRRRKAAAV